MNTKLLIVLLVVALNVPVLGAKIVTGTTWTYRTNTVEAANTAGCISFVAVGPNITIYSDKGNVDMLIPTVTNTTLWANTNVVGATWKIFASFCGTTVKTYEGFCKANETVVLRLNSNISAIDTNTVTILNY
jgi:hypothetical protein